MTFRVASAGSGGAIEVRLDAVDGPVVASALVTPTGGWQTYKDVSAPRSRRAARAQAGRTRCSWSSQPPCQTGLFNLNWLEVHGQGVSVADGTTNGLLGEYFATPDLTGPAVSRVDPQVSFDWGAGAPMDGVPHERVLGPVDAANWSSPRPGPTALRRPPTTARACGSAATR